MYVCEKVICRWSIVVGLNTTQQLACRKALCDVYRRTSGGGSGLSSTSFFFLIHPNKNTGRTITLDNSRQTEMFHGNQDNVHSIWNNAQLSVLLPKLNQHQNLLMIHSIR
jgi:predicted alternative tryptophan synthase beta-subunit